VRTLSLRGKLVVLAITGTVIPVVALAFTARSELGGGPLVLGYVALAMLALNFLQVRLITQLSLGARVRFALTGEEPDQLRAVMGSSSHRPITFMAGMTWHF
jgi:hypothetical protein